MGTVSHLDSQSIRNLGLVPPPWLENPWGSSVKIQMAGPTLGDPDSIGLEWVGNLRINQ